MGRSIVVADGDLDLTDLSRLVAVDADITYTEAARVTQSVVDVIGRALAEGRKVKITNFGTLAPRDHVIAAGALGGRVATPRTVKTVKFHLNGRLHDAVRNGTPVTTLRKASKSY